MSRQLSNKVQAYLKRNTPTWGNQEYPLFTEEAADACPTARYVGGVSRWLCECKQPTECPGVVIAAEQC